MIIKNLIIIFMSVSLSSLMCRYYNINRITQFEEKVKELCKKNQELRDNLIENKNDKLAILKINEYTKYIIDTIDEINNYKYNENIEDIQMIINILTEIQDKLNNKLLKNKSILKENQDIPDRYKNIKINDQSEEIDIGLNTYNDKEEIGLSFTCQCDCQAKKGT